MALLTKEERETLNKEQRKALRAERRAERRESGKGFRIKIDWAGLLTQAEALILDIIEDDIPGPQKMDEVLSSLASRADDFMKWDSLGIFGTILEAVDGPIITAIFGALVRPQIQNLYDRMHENGKV
ncbi:MAG: hypothetical protein KAJ19_09375 [Gammaproteobacteria bacterium]|nr:hypothetical protein [Gammaproteobacteria bacterium]